MKVLLINPPYQTITSNFGVGHQIPLGLLMVGGPLIDAGHEVRLLDAECHRLSLDAIVRAVRRRRPDVVMTGHAGSTPAHPTCTRMLRAIKAAEPGVVTVYGGVYPTYHASRILADEPAVDIIVRGEGEATALELLSALESGGLGDGSCLGQIPGLAYRNAGAVALTDDRPPIRDLDGWRVGWELIEPWDDYRCFGLGRAAIVQFSRGCPHRCTYCGQHAFWVKWRHRDPARLVDEIAWLHHTHGINFLTLADENPTTLKEQWQSFLEKMVASKLPVRLFATIRATDIVRDCDILHLYREAGILYVLMGVESTDDEVLRQVQKGSTTREDFEACRLLKEHGIFSIIGHIVGLGGEDHASFRTALRQLRLYDGDYLNAMYVTPHAWTPFGEQVRGRRVVEPDQAKWDYRHQVLAQQKLRPWQLFLAVKWLELRFHLRPGRLRALLREPDRRRCRQQFWVFRQIALVWLAEVFEFLVRTPRWPGQLRPATRPFPGGSMMDRPFERFFWLNVGVLAGTLGSAAVGAVFGLAFWVTGIGFAYDWLDWPIGGALFGLVIGAIGATIVRAVHAVGARGIERLGVPPLAAVAVALSAVAGLMIGSALFSGNGIAQAALFGILGGLGSAIGGVIAGRIGR